MFLPSPSQKTYLGLTGKGYKDCLRGPGHRHRTGRLEGPRAKSPSPVHLQHPVKPESLQRLSLCSQRGLCPPGPKCHQRVSFRSQMSQLFRASRNAQQFSEAPVSCFTPTAWSSVEESRRLLPCPTPTSPLRAVPPGPGFAPGDSYRCAATHSHSQER